MITIRPWLPGDSIADLTDLLHRAYRPLAEAGMRFMASHQDEATTRRRIAKGDCFVAERDRIIIGAVVYYSPGRGKGCPWYERPDVAYFGQFAVEPALQRAGIGSLLMHHVEERARADGAAEMALDTSELAAHLIAYYEKRGYRFIEHVRWKDVNYRSVILSKTLISANATGET